MIRSIGRHRTINTFERDLAMDGRRMKSLFLSKPNRESTLVGSIRPVRTFVDPRGALSVIESGIDLPFVPKRLYMLHTTNGPSARGGHAHKALRQFLVAVAGRAVVRLDNGETATEHVLDTPSTGLLIEPVTWREIELDANAVLCVLASENYDEADYIREYSDFLRFVGAAP
jgi:hypothetical protein